MKEPDAAQFRPESVSLFLDVDGTLIEFAPTPDTVVVPPALLEQLASLENRLGGALALVSGRQIVDLDALFAPLNLRASGVHGSEIRYEPGGAVARLASTQLGDEIWNDLQRVIARFPGSFSENKGYSFAVHYRFANASANEFCKALRDFVRRIPTPPLEVVAGHFVYEIKLAGIDKGSAIERFMMRNPFAGRTPIFIGDDRIDQPGFDKVTALGGVAYSVGAELLGVSGWFSRPTAVRAWLERLGR
jgi:trehalose 6-phosphate phosphatase